MIKRLFLWLIRFYRRNISPLTPPACRFQPTCSAYALQAIERFGALKGGAMAFWRVMRCGPWTKGGYDPVPEKKKRRPRHSDCCCEEEPGLQGCAYIPEDKLGKLD